MDRRTALKALIALPFVPRISKEDPAGYGDLRLTPEPIHGAWSVKWDDTPPAPGETWGVHSTGGVIQLAPGAELINVSCTDGSEPKVESLGDNTYRIGDSSSFSSEVWYQVKYDRNACYAY